MLGEAGLWTRNGLDFRGDLLFLRLSAICKTALVYCCLLHVSSQHCNVGDFSDEYHFNIVDYQQRYVYVLNGNGKASYYRPRGLQVRLLVGALLRNNVRQYYLFIANP